MPRTISLAAPSGEADALLARLRNLDGVTGVALQRGASIDPPGDVLTLQTTTAGAHAVMRELKRVDFATRGNVSTATPRSLAGPSGASQFEWESSEPTVEEMAFLLRFETNPTLNYLALMALSGAIAATGLWTDKVHIVIGAMIVAPGFEPFLRPPLGLVHGPRQTIVPGTISIASGYVALAVSAALAFLILRAIDPSAPTELEAREWVRYWSSLAGTSFLVTVFSAFAGAVTVTADRPVLTAGVMVALSLVPGMAIAGMAAANGDFDLAASGLLRWAIDAAAVTLAGAVVFAIKHRIIHRHRSVEERPATPRAARPKRTTRG